MRLNEEKLVAVVAILSILASSFFLLYHTSVAGEETISGVPVMKLVDSTTGLDSVTFGGTGEPMPSGGYNLTVNATLENVADLYTYEVAIQFNQSMMSCTGAKINSNDPNYIFYNVEGGSIIVPAYFNTNPYYVAIGASGITNTVTASAPRLLAQFTFVATKVGTSNLELILQPPTLSDQSSQLFAYDMSAMSFLAYNISVTVNQVAASPPTASFTFSPLNPKPTDVITFDASSSISPGGNIINYDWSFGDNTTSSTGNSTIEHLFPVSGAYNVSLTVFDDTGSGFNGTTSSLIQIGAPPIANFTYGPERPLPLIDTVTFNASSSFGYFYSPSVSKWVPGGPIALYVWDFGDNTTATSNESSVSTIYAFNGVYNVTLTVFDSDGLFDMMTQTILVGERPVADFTFSPEFPAHNDTITFDGTISQQGIPGTGRQQIIWFDWDFGDYLGHVNGTFANASTVQYSYAYNLGGLGGNYTVTLTVYDGFGLYGSVAKSVNVTDIGGGEVSKGLSIYWIILAGFVVAIVVVAVVLKKRQKPELARKERFRIV